MMGLKPIMIGGSTVTPGSTPSVSRHCSLEGPLLLPKNNKKNKNRERHCLSFERDDDSKPLTESDLNPICHQIKDVMRDFKGVCVSDLKLIFHSKKQSATSLTSSLQSKSSSLQRAVQEAKGNMLWNNSSPMKSSGWQMTKRLGSFADDNDLKEQVEQLKLEKEELKKRLREASHDVDNWKSKYQKQQAQIASLEEAAKEQTNEIEEIDSDSSPKNNQPLSSLQKAVTALRLGRADSLGSSSTDQSCGSDLSSKLPPLPEDLTTSKGSLRPKTYRRRNSAPVMRAEVEQQDKQLQEAKNEVEALKATCREQAEELEQLQRQVISTNDSDDNAAADLEVLKTKLRQANRDIADWKVTYQKQQLKIEALEAEATPLRVKAENVEEILEGLGAQIETQLRRIQFLEADNGYLLEKLQCSDAQVDNLRARTEEERQKATCLEKTIEHQKEQINAMLGELSGGEGMIMRTGSDEDQQQPTTALLNQPEDLHSLVQKLESKKHDALQSQLKLFGQVKRANECQGQLETCRREIEELRQSKVELEAKVQTKEEVIATAKAAVDELEETLATQQIQIESLSLVNREQRQQLEALVVEENNSEADYRSLPSSVGLESLASQSKDYFDEDDPMSASATQLEVLESLWDEQRAQVATIQQDQDEIFRNLGKMNSDATTKIDRLVDSIGGLANKDEQPNEYGNDDILVDATDLLDVIYEGGEVVDASSNDSEAVIEEFELAWMQQAEEIEALQRDQEKLLSRLKASGGHARDKREARKESTEDTEEDEEDLELTQEVRQKQNKLIKTLQADNKELIQKLRTAETSVALELGELKQEFELQTAKKEELELTCKQQEATIEELKEEKSALLQNSEELQSSFSEVDEEKATRGRDLETLLVLLEKEEANTSQQRETIDCLRGERHTLDQALEDNRTRVRGLEARCDIQKAAIDILQSEKDRLTNRLLDTEKEFRLHLTKNPSLLELNELRKKLAKVAGGTGGCHPIKSDLKSDSIEMIEAGESINIREVSFPTAATGEEGSNPGSDKDEGLDEDEAESKDNECPKEADSSSKDGPGQTINRVKLFALSPSSGKTHTTVSSCDEGSHPSGEKEEIWGDDPESVEGDSPDEADQSTHKYVDFQTNMLQRQDSGERRTLFHSWWRSIKPRSSVRLWAEGQNLSNNDDSSHTGFNSVSELAYGSSSDKLNAEDVLRLVSFNVAA